MIRLYLFLFIFVFSTGCKNQKKKDKTTNFDDTSINHNHDDKTDDVSINSDTYENEGITQEKAPETLDQIPSSMTIHEASSFPIDSTVIADEQEAETDKTMIDRLESYHQHVHPDECLAFTEVNGEIRSEVLRRKLTYFGGSTFGESEWSSMPDCAISPMISCGQSELIFSLIAGDNSICGVGVDFYHNDIESSYHRYNISLDQRDEDGQYLIYDCEIGEVCFNRNGQSLSRLSQKVFRFRTNRRNHGIWTFGITTYNRSSDIHRFIYDDWITYENYFEDIFRY